MLRFLVTGGAGFIGSNIAWHLSLERKAKVTVLDNFSSGNFKNLSNFKGDVIAGDVRDTSWYDKLDRVDVIYHQAAITDATITDQKLMLEVNAEGFRNILNYAKTHSVKRVIYASSASVYGNGSVPMREQQPLTPANIFAFSNAITDNIAGDFAAEHPEITVIGLRYFSVYGDLEAHKGKSASMIYQLYNQMKAGNHPRIFKSGEQKRDFVYIKDVLSGNIKALEAKRSCICNIGSGKARDFNAIVSVLNKNLNLNFPAEYIDNPYQSYQKFTEADLTNAKECLGYTSEWTLEDGIADYLEIMKGCLK